MAGRCSGMADPPSTTRRNAAGSSRPSAVGTSDTSVAGPPAATGPASPGSAVAPAAASNPSWTTSGVPVTRPGSRPTARRRAPAAGRPATGRRRGRRPGRRWWPGRGPHRVVGEHHGLGVAGRAAGGDDQGVAGLDRLVGPGRGQTRAGRGRGAAGQGGGRSPASHARRRASTNAGVPRASSTTSRAHAGGSGPVPHLDDVHLQAVDHEVLDAALELAAVGLVERRLQDHPELALVGRRPRARPLDEVGRPPRAGR